MPGEIERTRSKPPIMRRAGAGVVLIVAGVIAIHLLLGLIMTVVYVALAVAVVAAVVWAVATIL
jgi:hypothetical protein